MELNFYSSRKERLSQASSGTKRAYQKRQIKGFFKKNPQLKILIIDLLLVILFSTIIIPFFLKITKDIRFDDFKVESKAIIFDEKILVSIKISKLYKTISSRRGSETVEVTLLNDPIGQSKTEILPKTPGEGKYITFKLDENKKIEIINVRLSSGQFIKEYKIRVEK